MIGDTIIRFKPAVKPDADACPQEPRPAFLKKKYVIPIEIKKPKKTSHFLLNCLAGSRPASSEKKPTFEYLEQKQLIETPLTNGDTPEEFKDRPPITITKQAKKHIEAITLNFNKVKQNHQPVTNYSNVLFVRKRSMEKHTNQPKGILISNFTADEEKLSPILPDPRRLFGLPGDSHSEIASVVIQPILSKPEDAPRYLSRKLSTNSVRVDMSRSFGGREQVSSFVGGSAGLRSAMSSALNRSVASTRSVQTPGQLQRQLRTPRSPKSATTKRVTFAKHLVVFPRR